MRSSLFSCCNIKCFRPSDTISHKMSSLSCFSSVFPITRNIDCVKKSRRFDQGKSTLPIIVFFFIDNEKILVSYLLRRVTRLRWFKRDT